MTDTRKRGARAGFCALLAFVLCAVPLAGVAPAAPLPDLVVSIFDTPDPVAAGGSVFYEVEVYNDGAGVTTTPVKLTIQLAPGVTAVDLTFVTQFRAICSVSTPAGAGAIITCISTTVRVDSMAVKFMMSVPAGASSLSATAHVDPDNVIAETRETNNRRTALTTVTSEASPPVSFAQRSPAPVAGWHSSDVSVTLSATDVGSGVKELHFRASGATLFGPTTVEGEVVTFELNNEGATTVSYFAVDRAGNVEATNQLLVRIDRTAPVLTCGALPDGWSATNVEIGCQAADGGSGLDDETDASFTLATQVPEGEETDSATIEARTVCDVAGNCSTIGPFEALKVDRKDPTVDVSAFDGRRYLLHETVSGSHLCADGGSGVVSCEGPAVSTAAVGAYAGTVTAIDGVGNVTQRLVSYEVTYGVCPLTDPSKPGHPGSTLVLKLSLCDATGANVSNRNVALTSLEVVPVSPGASVSSPFDLGGGKGDWRYGNAHHGSYSRNLSTKGSSAGTYELRFNAAGDPVTHGLVFTLRGGDDAQAKATKPNKGKLAKARLKRR